MARKKSASYRVPTDEEILTYNNVPVMEAAKYIGWSTATLYYALQDGRCPFGFVSVNDEAKTFTGNRYTYNISPGLLVAYKKGTLACPRINEMINLMVDTIHELVADGRIISINKIKEEV